MKAYWQHFKFAAQLSLVMLLVAPCVFINAVIPCLFKNIGAEFIRAMAEAHDEIE